MRMRGDLLRTADIASRVEGLNASLELDHERQDEMNDRPCATEARFRKQFTTLDALMRSMNGTSTFLARQLADITATKSKA
jgi:flagellar hook-associated protein 2